MNVELVAQMFKNYQSNVLFHLEGLCRRAMNLLILLTIPFSYGWFEGSILKADSCIVLRIVYPVDWRRPSREF